MKRRHFLVSAASVACGAVLPWRLRARAAAAAIDLDVISNRTSSFAQLSRQEVAAVFTRAIRTWRGGEVLRPFNFRPGSPERVTFDHVVLDMDPDQSAQLWIDKLVRGEGEPPRKVSDARTMLKVVASLPGGIGYVPAGVADASVKIVARIRNGKVEAA